MAEITVFHDAADLIPVKAKGWQVGFPNMFKRELERVWNPRAFSIQTLAWLVLLNFVLAMFIQMDPGPFTITIFMYVSGVLVPMGAAVIASGSIIGEKNSGTAAWVLSKPASRTGFIMAKFLAISSGFLTSAVVIQGIVAYAQLSLATKSFVAAGPFIGGMLLLSLAVLFYLSMTLMLGTMFESRMPVMGIPVALVMGQIFLSLPLSDLADWLPYLLPGNLLQLGATVTGGTDENGPWIITVLISLVFTGLFLFLALHRIHQDEL
ncbi:ABC transporter permease subunit [Dehalogenimonas sp. 4OHTPN]|uniref:ABC transporter permease subunit n=1 Tax=Dehalogenimonas sp. 4OHTPN TaxID=3166643 RepID=A0AAU8G8S2_9CHLR